MARRKGRKGRRKGKMSVAVLPILPVAYVAYSSYKSSSTLEGALNSMMMKVTGYAPMQGTYNFDTAKPFLIGEGVAIVAHKVANKVGVNKHVRKLTGGWISL